jgi:hypothetical protein
VLGTGECVGFLRVADQTSQRVECKVLRVASDPGVKMR